MLGAAILRANLHQTTSAGKLCLEPRHCQSAPLPRKPQINGPKDTTCPPACWLLWEVLKPQPPVNMLAHQRPGSKSMIPWSSAPSMGRPRPGSELLDPATREPRTSFTQQWLAQLGPGRAPGFKHQWMDSNPVVIKILQPTMSGLSSLIRNTLVLASSTSSRVHRQKSRTQHLQQ